jgi:hypothetical protein
MIRGCAGCKRSRGARQGAGPPPHQRIIFSVTPPIRRLTEVTVHITWTDPHNIGVQTDGRHLHISGEGLLGEDAGFVIYAACIQQWDDGTPMSDEVKTATLDQVDHEAATRGWSFQIVW